MKTESMNVVAPHPVKHHDEMFDLISKVFTGVGYYRFMEANREGYIDHSHYDWNVSRVGFIDDVMVTHYGVWDYLMRVGAAKLRTGGIGAVATHGEYRKRGLMAQTIPHSLDAMRQAGYDVSILFGIRDFYHKFGYCRAWSSTHYTVNVAELERHASERRASRGKTASPALRKLKLEQTDEVARLYNRFDADAVGTAVRPTYERVPWPGKWEGWKWTDAKGRPAGWVIVDTRPERMECHEAVGDTDACLGVIAKLAKKNAKAQVRFIHFPAASELVRQLKRGSCTAETNYHRSGGAMIRTINLVSSLHKMSGELSRRLKDSCACDWKGKFVITDGRDTATLSIDRAEVSASAGGTSKHALRGGDHVAQLLIGTDEPDETIEGGRMRAAGDARMLVRALFPAKHPSLRTWDHY